MNETRVLPSVLLCQPSIEGENFWSAMRASAVVNCQWMVDRAAFRHQLSPVVLKGSTKRSKFFVINDKLPAELLDDVR